MRAKLVVVGGDVNASEFDVMLPTVIGRAKSADLCLPQPLISRRHCQLYRKEGFVVVRDLGSLNGTFVDNEKIEGEHRVLPEQLLTFGTVTFRVLYEPMRAATDPETIPPVAVEALPRRGEETLRMEEPSATLP